MAQMMICDLCGELPAVLLISDLTGGQLPMAVCGQCMPVWLAQMAAVFGERAPVEDTLAAVEAASDPEPLALGNEVPSDPPKARRPGRSRPGTSKAPTDTEPPNGSSPEVPLAHQTD